MMNELSFIRLDISKILVDHTQRSFGTTNMEAVKRILLVLATVIVASECFVVDKKREEYQEPPYRHSSPCLNGVNVCMGPVGRNPLFRRGLDFRSLLPHIDEVCQIYDEVESCLRPYVEECDMSGLQSQLQAGVSVGDFLCSSRGRSLLREVQSSVCYTDPSKVYELQLASRLCVAETIESEGRGQNICQKFSVVKRCLVQTATRECGETAGEILSEIFDRIIAVLHQYQCFDEEPHEYLKRGLEWFRK